MDVDVNKIEKQEAYLQFELYRTIKNYTEKLQQDILSRDILDLLDRKWERSFNIYPEVSINDDRIDLLITIDKWPFLVIETKKRYIHESNSIARKVIKTKKYSEDISARYYSVCNGWINVIFVTHKYPFLIGVYGVELNEDYVKNLLLGLVILEEKYKYDVLLKLPKVPDKFDIKEKIIPSILKAYSKIDNRINITNLSTWIEKIH